VNTSNEQKYVEIEQSRVLSALLRRLYRAVEREVFAFAPRSLLDAGCGEGHALRYLRVPEGYVGIDRNPACIALCRERFPARRFEVDWVYDVAPASFDVVMALEVLEHLDDPGEAVATLARAARSGLVLSVPFEPIFQIGNALRGKYRATWGNHPEHVQHWGPRGLRGFLQSTGVLDDLRVRVAGPWLVASGRPRRSARG
jgi:SAM-dependent methyltransferase